MGGYWKPYQRAIDDFFEWLFADKRTRRMLKLVPRGCVHCEILGICRDEENDWKCRNGCQFIEKEPVDTEHPVILNKRRFRMFKKDLPIKRVVIAGCRDYTDYDQAKEYIDHCLSNIRLENEIIVVSGGAKGADALGEQYAKANGFEIERYMADWDTYGKSAGPRRNKKMAEVSDFVICFWDGQSRGTKSMIEAAKALGKPVRVKDISK